MPQSAVSDQGQIMFARFDENPTMTLRVIKETKRYGQTHGRTDARTDNVKTVYPLQTKFAGGYNQMLQGAVSDQGQIRCCRVLCLIRVKSDAAGCCV